MGEVYRATDLNLHRDVAIKILPAQVAQDPERLSRFRREAHLLAALNHPNIAAIYGLEEANGKPFLALELVEGEDLSDHLRDGALPIDEALTIALQIAEALEEAHNKGIVHRDLKPGNVKLTAGGKVKVLDFGLAKAWGGDSAGGSSPSADVSHSPTLAFTGTMAGVILGTAAYMSPEQARGKPVDKRADVWAFGVLLWEMLTGRKLFTGDTITDVIAAVVTREPDFSTLPKTTPPAVRRMLARCLQKDPRRRLPDMGTARLELQDVLAGVADAQATPDAAISDSVMRVERGRRRRERWAWVALALTLSAAIVYLAVQRFGTPSQRPTPVHFLVDTPETLTFPEYAGQLAVSPDGRSVAFTAISADGTQRLWIRPFEAVDARPLAGTEEATDPFWSPDSTSIAFDVGRELRKVLLSSGTVQRICSLPKQGVPGGTWSEDGTIVFADGGPSATLYRVSAAGGEAVPLTNLDPSRGESGQYWPQFLPGGRELLFTIGSSNTTNTGLYALSLDAPAERRQILPDGAYFVFADGNLLAVHDGVLTARAFDPKRLAITGEPVSLGADVAVWSAVNSTWGLFSASTSGRLAWLPAISRELQLQWINRDGTPLATLGERRSYGQIVLSPDNKRVAAEIAGADGKYDLWIVDVARGIASRLTTDPANERDPVWSPDGQQIVFSSDASGDQNLLRISLQGSEPVPLPGGAGQTPGKRDIAENWLRDGNTLVYMVQAGLERTLNAVSLDGKDPPEVVSTDRFASDEHHVSPDGRWLTFTSAESGHVEVYVAPFRRRGETLRVSPDGGGQPRWRGDGKEIFYLANDGRLMAASVREGANGLEVGIPTTLIPADRLKAVIEGPDYDDYAVSSDGQRFLVKLAGGKNDHQRIHVLLNWTSGLH
jgi:eukaryotic-like serine/threonine-protein kinase